MEKQPNKGSANQQPVDNFSENNCLNIVAVFTELSNFTPLYTIKRNFTKTVKKNERNRTDIPRPRTPA